MVEENRIPKLNILTIGLYCGGRQFDVIDKFTLCNKGVEELEDIGACRELRQINLSNNRIKILEGLKYLYNLTYMKLSSNLLRNMDDLELLTNLITLDLSNNKIKSISGISTLGNLKALILNNNKIKEINGLSGLRELSTIILSHNLIKEMEGIGVNAGLRKISLSHNKIRGITGLDKLSDLEELRLNGNKIMLIPENIKINGRLKILDIGNNLLTSRKELRKLRFLPLLINLNIQGNEKLEMMDQVKISKYASNLHILNNQRIKQKQKKEKAIEASEFPSEVNPIKRIKENIIITKDNILPKKRKEIDEDEDIIFEPKILENKGEKAKEEATSGRVKRETGIVNIKENKSFIKKQQKMNNKTYKSLGKKKIIKKWD